MAGENELKKQSNDIQETIKSPQKNLKPDIVNTMNKDYKVKQKDIKSTISSDSNIKASNFITKDLQNFDVRLRKRRIYKEE